jgi:UDP-N-acetylglucosamine enolpyruvyl transferase
MTLPPKSTAADIVAPHLDMHLKVLRDLEANPQISQRDLSAVLGVSLGKTNFCLPEITVQEMCAEMMATDLAQTKQHALLKKHGYEVNVSVD